jgi:hypothetical protein
MENGLQLLMRDGALRVAFQKHLTSEQYAELLKVVTASDTKGQLARGVQRLAAKWGIEAEANSDLDPMVH